MNNIYKQISQYEKSVISTKVKFKFKKSMAKQFYSKLLHVQIIVNLLSVDNNFYQEFGELVSNDESSYAIWKIEHVKQIFELIEFFNVVYELFEYATESTIITLSQFKLLISIHKLILGVIKSDIIISNFFDKVDTVNKKSINYYFNMCYFIFDEIKKNKHEQKYYVTYNLK